MALATLDEVKTFLGITGTDEDDLLTALLDRASADFEKVAKRSFAEASYTETHDGGGDALVLINRPVVSVAQVIDYADPDNPATVEATDYVVYGQEGYVARGSRGSRRPCALTEWSVWPRGLKRWEIEYTAGYDTIPDDIVQAVLFMIQDWYSAMERDGAFQSERLGDYQYTIDQTVLARGMPARTYQTAIRYREDAF